MPTPTAAQHVLGKAQDAVSDLSHSKAELTRGMSDASAARQRLADRVVNFSKKQQMLQDRMLCPTQRPVSDNSKKQWQQETDTLRDEHHLLQKAAARLQGEYIQILDDYVTVNMQLELARAELAQAELKYNATACLPRHASQGPASP